MERAFRIIALLVIFPFLGITAISSQCIADIGEPRGEIRVVESWRPDINVLGHNVLEYLFDYALDKKRIGPLPCFVPQVD